MKKPAGWPRYMIVKHLKNGPAYYWNPPKRDIDKGFPIRREKLGSNYLEACIRCDGDPKSPNSKGLNGFLDDWRSGCDVNNNLEQHPKFGTVDWWLEAYMQSIAFGRLRERTKSSYSWQLKKLSDLFTNQGTRLGELPSKSITAAAVDKLYFRLQGGEKQRNLTSANHILDAARVVWRVVQRTYPEQFVPTNPFVGVSTSRKREAKKAATRNQTLALSKAIQDLGHPHLAIAPLVCFDWLQRPENLLAGHLQWTHYRPQDRPNHVKIIHHKTGEEVWHPLEDEDGILFYPELDKMISRLPHLGVSIIVTNGQRGPHRTYSREYYQRIVRTARNNANLPPYITLDACRHGGMTELGDAELTEQGIIALSGHTSPSAARGYIKKTETQRLAATRRRMAWRNKKEQRSDRSQKIRREMSQKTEK